MTYRPIPQDTPQTGLFDEALLEALQKAYEEKRTLPSAPRHTPAAILSASLKEYERLSRFLSKAMDLFIRLGSSLKKARDTEKESIQNKMIQLSFFIEEAEQSRDLLAEDMVVEIESSEESLS